MDVGLFFLLIGTFKEGNSKKGGCSLSLVPSYFFKMNGKTDERNYTLTDSYTNMCSRVISCILFTSTVLWKYSFSQVFLMIVLDKEMLTVGG